MPQVDLSSVCGGGADRKVACETLSGDADAGGDRPVENDLPDYAPESFWLSRDAELDWLDQNAFIERKDSGKGNSISNSTNLNPNLNSASSISQRYSVNLKSKPSIIGLPKTQKANYAEAKLRRNHRPASVRLFPKRTETAAGKASVTVTVTEPSSPKVSCIGRVRSRKDRSRRKKTRRNKVTVEPPVTKSKKVEGKSGFWRNFRSIFRRGDPKPEGKIDIQERLPAETSSPAGVGGVPVEPPGLGGMKRFVSGRRSDAWAAEIEVDGARSEPLDRGVSIWRRRDAAPPSDVGVGRDLNSVGPASV